MLTIILYILAGIGALAVFGLISMALNPEEPKKKETHYEVDEDSEEEDEEDDAPQEQGVGWLELLIYDAIAHPPRQKPNSVWTPGKLRH